MRIVEDRHPGEPWLLWKLGNWLSIDDKWIRSLGIAWLFKENGRWCFRPRFVSDQSLFFNAIFFVRLTFIVPFIPAGLFASFRWSSATDKKALLQAGVGIKLNGRIAVLLRVQSDKTSAAGVTGVNLGQAIGFDFGTH